MTMDPGIVEVVEQCLHASHDGTRSFPDILVALAAQGIESYRIDYREQRATYFHGGGDTHAIDLALGETAVGDRFDAETIVQNIRASQRRELGWPAFVAATREAGCIGYVVWLAGRHVSYFGRRGEVHVERFPDALVL